MDEAVADLASVEMVRTADAVAALSRCARRAWERYLEGVPEQSELRPVILESWDRSRRAGVDPRPRTLKPRRVSEEELEERTAAGGRLIRAARPHLEWASAQVADTPHVIYLVDRDGIVLDSVRTADSLAEAWGLLPGYDWSEEAMGTNGAGTALASGRVTAVIGAEHFAEPFHDSVCLAAPVRAPDGRIIGAIDLTTSLDGADPERFISVAYAAAATERDLAPVNGSAEGADGVPDSA